MWLGIGIEVGFRLTGTAWLRGRGRDLRQLLGGWGCVRGEGMVYVVRMPSMVGIRPPIAGRVRVRLSLRLEIVVRSEGAG